MALGPYGNGQKRFAQSIVANEIVESEVSVGDNTSGTLVSTFGTNGIVLTDTDGGGSGNAILVSGSSIWVAGGSNSNRTAILVQYNSNGAFDQYVRSPVSSNATWNAMALSGSDLVVAGVANSGTISLAEYNTAGNLVTSFGTGGIVMTNIGGNATANAIMVETSGKILVTGTGQETYLHTNDSTYTTAEEVLVQYQSNGSLDPTFGTGGIALPLAVPNVVSAGYAVNMLSNGDIAVAGQIEDSSDGHDIFVAEYSVATTPSSTYTYDVRNKMVGFSGATGTASYVYDNSGNRVQEKTGGTTSFYLTDTANPTGYAQPIEVWTSTSGSLSSATLNTTYLIGDRILGQDVAGTLSYLLVDGQENTRLLTNGTGAVTAVFNYDAFGDAVNFNLATAPTGVLFQQTFYDPTSGLNLYGDATRGTEPGEDFYIEMDGQGYAKPIDPVTLNSFLLDNANPLNGWDPSGHDDLGFGFASIEELLLGICFQQGGPDITAQLEGLAKFMLNYNQPHKHALPSTGIGYAYWDIDQLRSWGEAGGQNTAPGIVTFGGTSFSTVTVAGNVYRPEQVNYFLWGLWNRATGASLSWALDRVAIHQPVDKAGREGREAWTTAGYNDNFSLAESSAIPSVNPGTPYSRPLTFSIGDRTMGVVGGYVDASGNVVAGQ